MTILHAHTHTFFVDQGLNEIFLRRPAAELISWKYHIYTHAVPGAMFVNSKALVNSYFITSKQTDIFGDNVCARVLFLKKAVPVYLSRCQKNNERVLG